ncbi:MAG: InlB B-repeat-containing protein, partial [Christensenellales bacterium]
MKKHARLTILLLAVVLICSLALVLAACDSKEDSTAKTPSHLVFDTPSNGLTNPVSTDEFKFSDVKMYVVYTDGSRSNAITFDESMLSPSNEGNLDSVKPGGTARIVFTASYTTGGVTLDKSTFAIYFKRPDNVERVTYKFYTNGANVEDFELQIPVGTVFNTYQEFLTYIETNYELVAKTRYTLAGWLDTQGQDVGGMDAAQIERNYGRYNMANNFVKIEVKKGISNYFYATWTKDVAKVTFDYNFKEFGMTTATFAHVTPAINADELGEAKEDQKSKVSMAEPLVTEYYTMGYDTAQRPNTYVVDSFGNLASKPTPLQEIVPGYTFDGWYSDKEFTKAWSFSGVVKDNMTLYAKWSKKQYTITLDLGGGFFNADYIRIQDGNGYYEKDDYGNYVVRGDVVRSDSLSDVNDEAAVVSPTVIRYTGLEYKANVFSTTNRSYYLLKSLTNVNVSSNRIFYKGKIDNNTYYYNFAGWFYDANFNQPFELSNNSFTEDLYLYAKWELVSDPSLQASYYKDYLFKNCLELKADGTYKITGINDKTITSFTIPISIGGIDVTEIGNGAFMSCLSLLKVEISGGTSSKLSKIGDKAFAFCSKLSEINKICEG